jgi:hypothetical protein
MAYSIDFFSIQNMIAEDLGKQSPNSQKIQPTPQQVHPMNNIDDDAIFQIILNTVLACCTEDPRTGVPEVSAMSEVCIEISALIPENKHKDLEILHEDEPLSMFSRGVAEVIAWLDLLKNQMPYPSKNDADLRRREGLVGLTSICRIALFRQVKGDKDHPPLKA